jgi:hypothetical protein
MSSAVIAVQDADPVLVAEIGQAQARQVASEPPQKTKRCLFPLAGIPVHFIGAPKQSEILNEHAGNPIRTFAHPPSFL